MAKNILLKLRIWDKMDYPVLQTHKWRPTGSTGTFYIALLFFYHVFGGWKIPLILIKVSLQGNNALEPNPHDHCRGLQRGRITPSANTMQADGSHVVKCVQENKNQHHIFTKILPNVTNVTCNVGRTVPLTFGKVLLQSNCDNEAGCVSRHKV